MSAGAALCRASAPRSPLESGIVTQPKIAVHGACGRMGQMIVRAVHADKELILAAALDAPGHPQAGRDVGEICGAGPIGVHVSSEIPRGVDCVIDFSVAEAALRIAKQCAEREIALLVATTGLTDAHRDEVIACHHTCPLIVSANVSLVVNVLNKVTRDVARILRDRDFDVEIVERHHRFKVDAPSGTALHFAKIIEEGMNLTERRYGREGLIGERPRSEICIHSIRGGGAVGEHEISFSTLGEELELIHRGHTRDSYVSGAIAAAKFLVAQKPGLYTMADVLGL
jgi:4-hydroxy-tetrahydrodipicolinate reductase